MKLNSISWTSRNGESSSKFSANTHFNEDQIGDGIFGLTYYHSISVPIDATKGISSFVVHVRDGQTTRTFNNGGNGFQIEDIAFINPQETTMGVNGATTVTAAVWLLCKEVPSMNFDKLRRF